jgi:hypothetical protein
VSEPSGLPYGLPATFEEYERRTWEDGGQLIPMAAYLWRAGRRRKLRLFTLACIDRLRPHLTDPRSLAAVAFFEKFAEKSGAWGRRGRAAVAALAEEAAQELRAPAVLTPECWAESMARTAALSAVSRNDYHGAHLCGQMAAQARLGEWALANGRWPPDWSDPPVMAAWHDCQREVCGLLKEVAGDPFHPATFSPAWRTDTAVALARQMYDSRDFGAMPILADALQEAGCDCEDVLNHCRDAGATHVRGCWVVDLLLGKE